MSEPLELAAVQRDDLLLDLLGRRERTPGDFISVVLAGLRADVSGSDEWLPADEAVISSPSVRRRVARPLLAGGVVAGILLSATGIAAAAARATPGSVLWPVTQVVATKHAHSVMARERVLRSLAVAKKQAIRGDAAAARASLDDARSRVDEVRDSDGRSTLQARLAELQAIVDGTAPLPVQPPVATSPSPSPAPPSPVAAPSASPSPVPSPSPTPDPTPTPDPSPLSSPGAAPPG